MCVCMCVCVCGTRAAELDHLGFMLESDFGPTQLACISVDPFLCACQQVLMRVGLGVLTLVS